MWRQTTRQVNPATLSLDLKHLKAAGPPVPRHHDAVVTAAKEEETVDFKMPKGAKPGQILHVLVPGQHDLQAIRVPSGAKAGNVRREHMAQSFLAMCLHVRECIRALMCVATMLQV